MKKRMQANIKKMIKHHRVLTNATINKTTSASQRALQKNASINKLYVVYDVYVWFMLVFHMFFAAKLRHVSHVCFHVCCVFSFLLFKVYCCVVSMILVLAFVFMFGFIFAVLFLFMFAFSVCFL